MTAPGDRAYATGRLSDFESADDEDFSLGALLPRRARTGTETTTDAPATPTTQTPPVAPQPTPSDNDPHRDRRGETPDEATRNGANGKSSGAEDNARSGAQARSSSRAATTTPAKKTAAKKTTANGRSRAQHPPSTTGSTTAATPPAANGTSPAPANPVTGRGNLIKPSSAQIPSALIPLIARRREETGRSNGEIVLDAIEATHPDLGTLLHPRGQAGGGLFAARASRGVRKVDGPLTGLNIRLYEADYDVIDQLVTQFGALSRGHLISVALTAFLHEDPTE